MFLSFCFVLFVILKSLSLRIVRADQHCPQPTFIFTCQRMSIRNQKAKQRRLWTVSSGVEVTSSCLCVGQAFLKGKELCCHTNPLSGQPCRARVGAAAFWGCTLRTRHGWGLEKLEGQTPGLWAWAVSGAAHCLWAWSKSLSCSETPSLFICLVTSSVLASGETRWGKPPARNRVLQNVASWLLILTPSLRNSVGFSSFIHSWM